MTNARDFTQFAPKFLRIATKSKRIVPLNLNAAQSAYWQSRTMRDLILKPRQVGFSTVLQAENYWRVVTAPNSTMTLGKDDENTQMLRRIFQRYHDKFPTNPKPQKRLDNDTLSTFPDYESEALIATAGRTSAGRGGTLTFLHGSEVAFWRDAEELIAGALQAGNPRVVLESTPNGAQGYFYKLCMDALDGLNDWRLFFWTWFQHAEYRIPLKSGETLEPYTEDELRLIAAHNLTPEQIKWRRNKQRELGRKFPQEYPENPRDCFLLSGESYFGDLAGIFIVPYGTKFERNHRHVAGLDFAQTNDFTTLVVWDTTAKREVDALHINKLPWEEMRRQALVKCQKWGVSTLVYEQNSMGSTNGEALQKEAVAMGMRDIQIVPFNTTAETKPDILAELHRALHEEGWKLLNDEIGRREMNAFVATQNPVTLRWKFEAQEGEHDDFVAARWCAKYATRMSGSMILFGA